MAVQRFKAVAVVYAHIVAVRPVIAGASAREGDNAIVGRINRRALRRGDVQPAVVIRAPARDALIIRHREHQLAGTGRAAQRAHLYDFGHGLHQRLFADYGAALLLPVLVYHVCCDQLCAVNTFLQRHAPSPGKVAVFHLLRGVGHRFFIRFAEHLLHGEVILLHLLARGQRPCRLAQQAGCQLVL